MMAMPTLIIAENLLDRFPKWLVSALINAFAMSSCSLGKVTASGNTKCAGCICSFHAVFLLLR
jgi:hypothetical protein